MERSIERREGLLLLASVSIAASLLGSAIAATGISIFIELSDGRAPAFTLALFLLCFGSFFAVPIALLVGVPTLVLARRFLPRHSIPMTVGFALLGLLGGAVLEWLGLANGGEGRMCEVFGASVGGMHAVIYSRLKGACWISICTAFSLSIAAVWCAASAGESLHNEMKSREEYEDSCFSPYDLVAHVTDRADLHQRTKSMPEWQGKWLKHPRWQSLYSIERWVPLNDERVLIVRDFAYVPSGILGWITGGRRIARHCLSERKAGKALFLRRFGLAKRPVLNELIDQSP